jgi:hypothetical protein
MPPADHHPQHVGAARAERHPHADLARALGHLEAVTP